MSYKIIISIISVILVFVGYSPYIWDILKRRTTPHTFTFLVWGLASSITWALQVHGGAGVGAWITFAVSAVCIFIFFLCFKYGEKSITKLDVVFLVMALFSLFLWLVVKQPLLSVILVVLTDILGFGPTLRKSWNKPHSETLFTWWVAAFRHGLGIIALQRFNVFTLLYPVAWTLANLIFCIILLIRRRQVKETSPN
ncbi:MAG: hypothetical protein G01um101424_263 [Parcubacteria group bacterium Gr01-1014_24]|nr:MAG: hypothetical protein G01um101424_263 [Parcubacteria group bacterium Gr01-1014_24]